MHPNEESQEDSSSNDLAAPSDSSGSSSAVTILPSKPLESSFASSSSVILCSDKALSAKGLCADVLPSAVQSEDSSKHAPFSEQNVSILNPKTSLYAKASSSVPSVKRFANPCVKIIISIKPATSLFCTEPGVAKFHLKPSTGPTRIDDPVIAAILESQRQNRYFPIPTYAPDFRFANVLDPDFKISKPLSPKISSSRPDRDQSLTFSQCNECTPIDGLYTECQHPEEEGDYDLTVNTDRIGQHIQPRRIDTIPEDFPDSIEYEMFNCRNLTALLSENTDEHASHFVVFTARGTLLGYSDAMKIKDARKVSALAGLTWRAKEAELFSEPGDSVGSPSLILETLSIKTKEDGQLASMVVKSEGTMAAVADVKETILVAALIALPAAPTTKTKKKSTKAQEKAQSSANYPPTAAAGTSGNDDPGAKDPQIDIKGKGKEPSAKNPAPQDPQPSSLQMKILTWKAEGMAEALLDDLHDFSMPEGAH